MEKSLIQKQVQIVHPEKVFYYLPNLTDSTLAALFGLSPDEYRSTKALFTTRVDHAVERLLSDADFKMLAEQLPFGQGDVVLVLGESNTDDYQSWFEILKGIVVKTAPEKNIRMINAAISGQTTTMALRNLTTNLQARPTWIFCMLGMNDALRIGGKNGKTVVSIDETKKNLDFIYAMSKEIHDPQWAWISPYPVDEVRQDQNKWFAQLNLKWYNEDLMEIHQHLASKDGVVVDLKEKFTNGDHKALLMEDGVHASLEGHVQIVRELIAKLTES
jgi:acyl-CoA thioesterase-1